MAESDLSRPKYTESRTASRRSVHEVSFKDFSELARRRGWSVEFLAERFRRRIEEPVDLFTRILTSKYKNEYRGDVLIPFRSILELYGQEIGFHQQEQGREKFCACGCGARVWNRKKWANQGCKKRAQRGKSETAKTALASA